jgi:hypothetical protein
MNLIYLPDSGIYLNPDHILYVRKTGDDTFSVKFADDHPNLIISLKDLSALTVLKEF